MKQQTTLFKQNINYIFVLGFLLISYFSNAQVFYTEDFETDGNGTRYFPEVEAYDGINDYFMRTDNAGSIQNTSANEGNGYSGASANFYWAGEDHNDGGVGGVGNRELELEIRDINIAGKIDLYFSALFGGYESGIYNSALDYVIVEYRIDNGAWLGGISFRSTSVTELLSEDADGDGVGDGISVLFSSMQPYGFSIPETGNEIDLRIRAGSGSSGEEWSIDLIQLLENSTLSNPENQFTENDIKVYSNGSGIFNIETPSTLKIQALEVFDLTGKNISSITVDEDSNNNSIDLSSLQSSIYILKIYTNKGVFNKKIIKK